MNYILCLIASGFSATNGIFIKQYQKGTVEIKNSDYIFNLIISLIAALFYAVMGAVSDGLAIHADFIPYSCLYAVCYVIGTVGYLGAVSRGSLLITVIMGQMGSLIPIVFSLIAYGDHPTVTMVIGMILLFLALLLFHMQKVESKQNKRSFWLFVFMCFAGNGGASLAIKMQQHEHPGEYQGAFLFYGIVFAAILFLCMVLIRPPKSSVSVRDGGGVVKILSASAIWAVLYGLCNAAVNYINAQIVSRLPTVAFYMCGMGFGILLSFVVARFIYRERLLPHQYVGCWVATAGLILLMAF